MILHRIEYGIADLLRSQAAVAVVRLEGENLKSGILEVTKRAWALLVIVTPTKEHFLVLTASPAHEGNLIGDVRRWTRQFGFEFFVKPSGEQFPTPRHNAFTLPNGREIEVADIFTRASNFTHWGLSKRMLVPSGYVRL